MQRDFEWIGYEDRVVELRMNVPGRPVNSLSSSNLGLLARIVREIRDAGPWRGLLLTSGKPGQFVAGADLREVGALEERSPEARREFVRAGHRAFQELENLPFPTVALVDGPCLGGGAELCLATDDCLATDSRFTRFGLPEVELGLIPSWGGTQRLPRRIGLPGIEVLASGNSIDVWHAARLGWVSDVVAAENLLDAGRKHIERLGSGDAWTWRRQRKLGATGFGEHVLDRWIQEAEGRNVGRNADRALAARVALGVVREGAFRNLADALEVETECALELLGSASSSNRIAVFFLRSQAAKARGDARIEPLDVRRVGIVGAGQMGSGIASAMGRAGISTRLVDVDEGRLQGAMDRIQDETTRRVRTGRGPSDELERVLERVEVSTSLEVLSDRDLVIEAITEDESQKRSLYEELAHHLPVDALLATNTTSLSIDRLASAVSDEHRFVGMHFFHPVERMELVEVVRGRETSDLTVATAVHVARRLGKIPIVVRDGPGFLVSRVLFPYLNEAVLLIESGAHVDEVDEAAIEFGMPMGPIALMDLIGIDTVVAAGRVLCDGFPDRAVAAPLLETMQEAGRLGRKSGVGFWKYEGPKGRPVADPDLLPILDRFRMGKTSPSREQIADRLFLPMVLEAVRALEDGIAESAGDVDLAMILGIGFPAHQGGPLRWCDRQGAGAVVERARAYQSLGTRFEPSPLLLEMAKTGSRFHPGNDSKAAGA